MADPEKQVPRLARNDDAVAERPCRASGGSLERKEEKSGQFSGNEKGTQRVES